MLILELAIQNVRGFSPSARVTFKPGYAALRSPTDLPAPLSGLLFALSYPDGRGGDAAFLAPGTKSGRAGFSVQSDNQTVWRLVRDLGGSGALHKLARETGQFEVVTQDSAEMAQVIRASGGFPVRSTFEQIFTLGAGQLPSRNVKVAKADPAAGKPRLAPSSFSSSATVKPASDVEAARARIALLEQEKRSAQTVGDVQFRFDGVQSELFKIQEKLQVFTQTQNQLAQARAELARLPTCESLRLPQDILTRVRRLADDRKRRDDALMRIEGERNNSGLNEMAEVPTLTGDQRFLAAVLFGLVLLVAPGFGEGSLRYASLLSVLPFTFAAILALRFIEDLQRVSRLGTKVDLYESRARKVNDDFELQESVVKAALAKAGTSTTEEFEALLGRRAEMEPEVARLEAAFHQMEADPEMGELKGLQEHLQLEQEELEDQLRGLGDGFVRDAREVDREIEMLQESIALAARPPEPVAPAEAFSAVDTELREAFEDPMPGLMVLASDLFGADVPTLWSVLRERAIQYLGALTDRRYHGMELDKDGRCTIEAPGRSLPAGALPGRDLDLAWLALRLTIIEKAAPQHRVPFIIEDSLSAAVDAAKQPLFHRMLKHLGSATQVLHVIGVSQNMGAEPVTPI